MGKCLLRPPLLLLLLNHRPSLLHNMQAGDAVVHWGPGAPSFSVAPGI